MVYEDLHCGISSLPYLLRTVTLLSIQRNVTVPKMQRCVWNGETLGFSRLEIYSPKGELEVLVFGKRLLSKSEFRDIYL